MSTKVSLLHSILNGGRVPPDSDIVQRVAKLVADANRWRRERDDAEQNLSDARSELREEHRRLCEIGVTCDDLRHELDATRRAKQENDERFMIERDEARAAADKMRPVYIAACRVVDADRDNLPLHLVDAVDIARNRHD